MEEEKYIKGKVITTIYENHENYFKIIVVKIEETDTDYSDNEITIVGTFGHVQHDETYEFFGGLKSHPRYGLQFEATRFQEVGPSSEEAIITYLSSSKFKGIGPRTAEKIVDTLGIDCLDLISDNPEVLKEVPGLNKAKRQTISQVLNSERGIQKIILKLNQYNIKSKLAYQIYSFYEEKTLEVIHNNPYQLIYDINNIGFIRADQIAGEVGIEDDAPERFYAAIVHTLNEQCLRNGHTYIKAEDLLKESIVTLESSKNFMIDPELLADRLLEMVDLQMLIQDENRFYLPSLFASEWGMVNAIDRIKSIKPESFTEKDLKNAIDWVEKDFDIKYGKSQRDAIINAISSPISILTGGPGTGKTTVLNGLIHVFADLYDLSLDPNAYKDSSFPILMAAPTGRAAKRMSETTGLSASTIHRLLGLTIDSEEVGSEMQLEGKLLIIDEMSMVDTWLGYQLLKSIPSGMQVVLVGDKDQLPSVGPGQVLKDLIDSQVIPQVELVDIYRQGDGSSIVPLAHYIKGNQLPPDLLEKKADRAFIEGPTRRIKDIVRQIVNNALTKGYTADDIQVLAPMYKGESGINELNQLMQELMNPSQPGQKEVRFNDVIYRIGDKVLHLVNDPERDVFNGDIGKIVGIVPAKESELKTDELVIDFDGNEVQYPRNDWQKITLSYCCSIHKSQGSEYKMVILPLTMAYHRMLRKDLLYTAITRASEFLILCGDIQAFRMCITTGNASRLTTLKDRLTYDRKSVTEKDSNSELTLKQPNQQNNLKKISYKETIPASKSEEFETIKHTSEETYRLSAELITSQKIDPMIGMGQLTPYDF